MKVKKVVFGGCCVSEEIINSVLKDMEKEGDIVLDIKFTDYGSGNWKCALILYEEKEKNNE